MQRLLARTSTMHLQKVNRNNVQNLPKMYGAFGTFSQQRQGFFNSVRSAPRVRCNILKGGQRVGVKGHAERPRSESAATNR